MATIVNELTKVTDNQLVAYWAKGYSDNDGYFLGYDTGPRWIFEWSSKSVGAGKTQVDWTLKTAMRDLPYTHVHTCCNFVLTYGTSTIKQSWGYRDNNNPTTKNTDLTSDDQFCANTTTYDSILRKSGSFTITHNTNGSASFTVKLTGEIWVVNNTLKESGTTFNLPTNKPYTKCTAPTSVTISPAIQKPSGEITISWSGAKGGTANAITKYKVWYKIGSGAWSSAYEAASTASSYRITLPSNAARGSGIQAAVQAIGTVSGYDSDEKWSNTDASKVNTLPGAPTVSASLTKVPSGRTSTLTFTAGTANDAGQTPSVWYSTTSSTANGVKYTAPFTWTPPSNGASVTYTVWTWDGLEYSAPTTIKIVGNKDKPTVTASMTGSALSSTNSVSGTDYVIAPKLTATPGTTSISNTYLYQVVYSTEKDKLSTTTNVKNLSEWTTATSLNISDIRYYIGTKTNTPIYYKIRIKRNDGVQEVQDDTDNIYLVTQVPSLRKIDNGLTSGKLPTYFLNTLNVHFDYDQGYNCIRLSKTGNTYFQNPYFTGTKTIDSKNTWYSNLGALSAIARDGVSTKYYYDLGYYSETSKSYLYTTSLFSQLSLSGDAKNHTGYTRIKVPGTDISVIKNYEDIHYPFIVDPKDSLGIDLSFYSSANRKKYGFNDSDSSLEFSYQTTINGATGSEQNSTATISDATLKVPLSHVGLFNSIDSSINKNYNGTYTSTITVSVKNAFNETLSYTITLKINFKENYPGIDIDETELLVNASQDIENNYAFLKEKMQLKLRKLICTSYHPNPKAQIYLMGKWHDLVLKKSSDSPITASPGQPYEYNVDESKIFWTIPALSTTYTQTGYTIKATNSLGVYNTAIAQSQKTFEFRHHISATLSNFQATIDGKEEDKNLKFSINLSNYGLTYSEKDKNNHYWLVLQYQVDNNASQNLKISYSNDTSSPTGGKYGVLKDLKEYLNNKITIPISTLTNNKQWTKMTIKLILNIRNFGERLTDGTAKGEPFNTAVATDRTVYSQTLVLYNTKPTVSYRQNKLGINYDFSDSSLSKPALVVQQHSNAEYIYLRGNDGTKDYQITINLKTGTIDGVTISGGSW